MASRALGAMLAIAAAILFVASLVSPAITTDLPAWWDGHPIVDGKERVIQDVHLGPFGAKGCNERGCATIDGGTQFQIMGYAEGGIVGLGAIFAFVLALSAWRGTDRRKAVAVCSLLVAILCAGGAVVLLWQGPEIQSSQHVEIPIGVGLFLFGGGVIAMGLASVITLASRPEPLRLKSPKHRVAAEAAPESDLRQIVRDQHESLRPSGSEGSQPLFEAAPQLRALYEMPGSAAPQVPQVNLPTRAPTPIPRASVSAIAGIPTPMPFDAPSKPPTMPPPLERPTPLPEEAQARPSRMNPPTNPPRSKASSVPPTNPPRAKAASVPPTNPPRASAPAIPPSTPSRAKPETNPPKQISNPPAAKPESNPSAAKPESRAKAASVAPTPLRGKGPTVPPPARPSGSIPPPTSRKTPPQQMKRSTPTISAAVAPPPDQAAARASQSRLDSEEDSEVTGVEELPMKGPVTAVEIDAAGKAAAKAAEAKRHEGQAARVAAEEEARRRSADLARIVEAKRREADERAQEDEAIAKRRAARLLTGDGVDTSTDAEIGERRSEIVLGEGQLANDDISTPRAVADEGTDRIDDGVRLGLRRAPSATPIEPMSTVHRPTTEGPIIEQPSPVVAPPIVAAPIVATPIVPKRPASTAPQSLPPPKKLETPTGPTPACPQCEAPMAWVEEHLRFYCKSCRMYF